MKGSTALEAVIGFVMTILLWVFAPVALLFWVIREPFEPRRAKKKSGG